MSTRLLLCLALLGCGNHSSTKPAATTPAAPAPAPAPAPSAEPVAAPAPPAEPAGPKRLAPPQTWEEIGRRGDETFVMGNVVWHGGEAFEVNVMGTMQMILQGEIKDAIAAQPDDPGAAIQGVIDNINQIGGADSPLLWVRKQ